MQTIDGSLIHILSHETGDLEDILKKNRGITPENERLFFSPDISDLHDPFLMPDMQKAIERILAAREAGERIVIFGDYDVDGVSSTALLVRFLTEIGCIVSYRLPHRSRDGYGLKSYVFDELLTKNVTLVITVDCGTRDIEPIRYAKSLGIDVIVTDHHAVPEIIPEEVIAILNPKRKDSIYPFPNLAGSGVAFKLIHGILLKLILTLSPDSQSRTNSTLQSYSYLESNIPHPNQLGVSGVESKIPHPNQLGVSGVESKIPHPNQLGVSGVESKIPHPNPLPEGEGTETEKIKIPKYITELARKFRKNPTNSEEFLWEILRDRQFENLKFRRQHPISRYIADFYCDEIKLVIEIDGKIHENQKEYDTIRDEVMQGGGYIILRITDDEIYNSIESLLQKIRLFQLPSPSGRGAGGEGVFGNRIGSDKASGDSIVGEGVSGNRIGSDKASGDSIEDERLSGNTVLDQRERATLNSTLMRYIDFASLGTVADCMPLTGENRVIATLGLRQMRNSESAGLRKFLGDSEEKRDCQKGSSSNKKGKTSISESLDADIIGFQIGPRINASGRMDTPLTALRWLLASEERCDEFLEEIEELNTKRQEIVKSFGEKALEEANPENGILFYRDSNLEHGLIGLVAGKLTEAYNRPSIVLCEQHDTTIETKLLVASCRSPEWCHLVELLDDCKDFFVRYGGHRQAAGFTIEVSKYDDFQKAIQSIFIEKYGIHSSLPSKKIAIECELDIRDIHIGIFDIFQKFKPYGIANRKPIFLIKNLTLLDVRPLGESGQHMSFTCQELSGIRFLCWRVENRLKNELQKGNIISPIVEFGLNEWNGKKSLQCTVISILSPE